MTTNVLALGMTLRVVGFWIHRCELIIPQSYTPCCALLFKSLGCPKLKGELNREA